MFFRFQFRPKVKNILSVIHCTLYLHSNYSQILAYKKDQNMKKCFHVIDMAQDASVLLSVVSVDSLTIQTNFQSIVLPEKQTNI